MNFSIEKKIVTSFAWALVWLAKEKLKASLGEVNELKAALDEPALVAITDPPGKITFVNDRFRAISNYPRAELLGQDHRIINSGYRPKYFTRSLGG